MYNQISTHEYWCLSEKAQDFNLRDFEDISLFLINLENDDIDYSRIKDNGLSIKFWGKKKPFLVFQNIGNNEEIYIPENNILEYVTTSTTSTTTTTELVFIMENNQQVGSLLLLHESPSMQPHLQPVVREKKYFDPIQIQLNISKIPDEYFLVEVKVEYRGGIYFKIDQIDELIEFIKFVFDKTEMMPLKKMNEEIRDLLDSYPDPAPLK